MYARLYDIDIQCINDWHLLIGLQQIIQLLFLSLFEIVISELLLYVCARARCVCVCVHLYVIIYHRLKMIKTTLYNNIDIILFTI